MTLTIIGIVIAAASAIFAGISAATSRGQTRQQRGLQRPNLWVDLRTEEGHGRWVFLVVGNSGPSVAQNVKITLAPLLEPPQEGDTTVSDACRQLAQGIASLGPGREMRWPIGLFDQLTSLAYMQGCAVHITADSEHGAVDSEYTLNPSQQANTVVNRNGSLFGIAEAITSLREAQTKMTYMPDHYRSERLGG